MIVVCVFCHSNHILTVLFLCGIFSNGLGGIHIGFYAICGFN
jgi:hypothetical protein